MIKTPSGDAPGVLLMKLWLSDDYKVEFTAAGGVGVYISYPTEEGR